MICIIDVNRLVVAPASIERFLERIRTEESDVSRIGFDLRMYKDRSQNRSAPFADAAPAFHTIVSRNLGSGRRLPKVIQRKAERSFDQAINFQSIIDKIIREQLLIRIAVRVGASIGAKLRRYRALGKLLREPFAGNDSSYPPIEIFGTIEDRIDPG